MGDDTLRYVAHKSYCFYHQLIFSYVGRVDLFFTIRYTKLGLTLTHHIRKKQFFGEKWVKGGKALIFFCFCNWLLQTLDNSWGDPNVNGGDGMKQYSFTFEEIWVLLLHKLYTVKRTMGIWYWRKFITGIPSGAEGQIEKAPFRKFLVMSIFRSNP